MKRATKGKIYLSGGEISFSSPREAIAHHVALLPENRKEEGLFLDLNILKNVTMATLERDATMLVIDQNKGKQTTQAAIEGLKMRVPSANVNVSGLSGGNQQKSCYHAGRQLNRSYSSWTSQRAVWMSGRKVKFIA